MKSGRIILLLLLLVTTLSALTIDELIDVTLSVSEFGQLGEQKCLVSSQINLEVLPTEEEALAYLTEVGGLLAVIYQNPEDYEMTSNSERLKHIPFVCCPYVSSDYKFLACISMDELRYNLLINPQKDENTPARYNRNYEFVKKWHTTIMLSEYTPDE
jgi:hypothetical protein